MLIILEGMDGTGKSLLATWLEFYLLCQSRRAITYKHATQDNAMKEWMDYSTSSFVNMLTTLEYYKLLTHYVDDVLVDRYHLSEYVYGSLLRKATTKATSIFRVIDGHLSKHVGHQAVLILCDCDIELAKDRVLARDGCVKNITETTRRAFIKAYKKSMIANKMIYVNDTTHKDHVASYAQQLVRQLIANNGR
jgi:thymidylate kinase